MSEWWYRQLRDLWGIMRIISILFSIISAAWRWRIIKACVAINNPNIFINNDILLLCAEGFYSKPAFVLAIIAWSAVSTSQPCDHIWRN